MMRVGTQRRSKSSTSSPNATYRQSPTPHSSRTSPINQTSLNTSLNSSYNSASKNTSSFTNYRQTASPNFATDTHKYAQDYHKLSVNESSRRLSAGSPGLMERSISPSFAPRAASPSFAQRASPSFMRAQSPDYITSKKLNERRYETSSPSFQKRNEYDSSYTNKMSSMRVTDSRSPAFNERPPEVGFTSNSRYDKRVSETRSYNQQHSGKFLSYVFYCKSFG